MAALRLEERDPHAFDDRPAERRATTRGSDARVGGRQRCRGPARGRRLRLDLDPAAGRAAVAEVHAVVEPAHRRRSRRHRAAAFEQRRHLEAVDVQLHARRIGIAIATPAGTSSTGTSRNDGDSSSACSGSPNVPGARQRCDRRHRRARYAHRSAPARRRTATAGRNDITALRAARPSTPRRRPCRGSRTRARPAGGPSARCG